MSQENVENAPMRLESTVTIVRPPDDVWEFIADPMNDPKWCEKVVSVEQVGGDGPGLGAKYRVLHRPKPLKRATELAMEVVEFDHPHRMRLREEDEDAVFNVAYELEPTGRDTRVSQIDEIDWKISKLALPLARVMVRRDLRRQFESLKHLLESETADSVS